MIRQTDRAAANDLHRATDRPDRDPHEHTDLRAFLQPSLTRQTQAFAQRITHMLPPGRARLSAAWLAHMGRPIAFAGRVQQDR